jgi:polysaccharide export outer membrane protein
MCVNRGGVFNVLIRAFLPVFLSGLAAATPSFCQQHLETTEETNTRILERAKDTNAASGEYRLGSGDLVNVDVFDVPQLTRDVRVSEAGYISLPLLPVRVLAKGLTGMQLEEKISELLQANGLVSHPNVTVTLKEQHSQPITVIGAVKSPQVVQTIRPMSLLEVLSACGGITDEAGSTLLVTRDSQAGPNTSKTGVASDDLAMPQTFTISLWDLLNNATSKNNLLLSGGDIVTVPRAGIVYVVGAVNHPGGFVLSNDADRMTALKALALAQGAISTSKPNEAVILRRDPVTGKNLEIPVDLRKIMQHKGDDAKLEANDILFIPDSAGKHAMHRAADLIISLTSGIAIVRAGAL